MYKGVEIVRRYGNPAAGRHSLQIEINRRLYMDEARIAEGPGYAAVKSMLGDLIETLRLFAAACPPGPK